MKTAWGLATCRLILAGLFCLLLGTAWGVDVSLTASSTTPAVGSSFTVTVNLSSAAPFANWAQYLKFDQTRMALTAQTAGSFSTFIPDSRTLATINASGDVRAGGFAFANNAGGSGTLGIFTFTALAPGVTQVTSEAKSGTNPFGDVLVTVTGTETVPGIAGPLNLTIGGAAAPEIAVNGNGQNIADGDNTPSSADFTDFGGVTVGSSLDRTFTIQNTGTAALTVGAATASGTGFSVQAQPAGTVAAGASTTLVVRFAPGAAGAANGGVSFSNNDADENPFNFSLAGSGQAAAANQPPVLGSASALPNPVLAGSEVSFSASGSDADGDPLSFSWGFGDGSQATGSGVKHVYLAAGTYSVTVTVTDGKGGGDTESLSVVVLPNDSGTSKLPMVLKKLKGKTSFTEGGRDLIRVVGVVPGLPEGMVFEGMMITIDFGGVSEVFPLNALGKSRTANGQFGFKLKFKKDAATRAKVFMGGDGPFVAVLRRGSWSDDWSALGMAADAAGLEMSFGVDLSFDGKGYGSSAEVMYSAQQGVGKFKMKR